MIKDAGIFGTLIGGARKLFTSPGVTRAAKPLLAASALGAAGVAGGRRVFGMMNRKDVAKAMVNLAVKANPTYSTMTQVDLMEAVNQLEKAFIKDPALYAQALDIYTKAKESGRI